MNITINTTVTYYGSNSDFNPGDMILIIIAIVLVFLFFVLTLLYLMERKKRDLESVRITMVEEIADSLANDKDIYEYDPKESVIHQSSIQLANRSPDVVFRFIENSQKEQESKTKHVYL